MSKIWNMLVYVTGTNTVLYTLFIILKKTDLLLNGKFGLAWYDKLVFSGFYIILNLVFPIYLLYMYGTIDLDTINDCLKKDKGITMFIYLFVLLFGTALTIYIFIYLLKILGGK